MTPRYFDIHTHVNFSAFDTDREEVVARAREAGILMMNVGTQKDTSKKAIEMAEKYDNCYACIGLHPIHCDKSFHDEAEIGEGASHAKGGFTSRAEVFDYDYYLELAKHSKVLAIGETGLDYYHRETLDGSQSAIDENVAKQRESFLAHIRLAQEVGKPLMIHARPTKGSCDAYNDVIDILIEEKKKSPNVPLIANFHFFTGDIPTAKRILAEGWTMSFDGPVTFSRDYDDLIRFVPLESIMVETDAPYVAPKSMRGKRNEPSYLPEIALKVAEIVGKDNEIVRQKLLENALRVFKLEKTLT